MQNEQQKKVTDLKICACNQKLFNSFIDNFVTDSKSASNSALFDTHYENLPQRFLAHGKL
jgi:hypothetical protein